MKRLRVHTWMVKFQCEGGVYKLPRNHFYFFCLVFFHLIWFDLLFMNLWQVEVIAAHWQMIVTSVYIFLNSSSTYANLPAVNMAEAWRAPTPLFEIYGWSLFHSILWLFKLKLTVFSVFSQELLNTDFIIRVWPLVDLFLIRNSWIESFTTPIHNSIRSDFFALTKLNLLSFHQKEKKTHSDRTLHNSSLLSFM